MPDAMNNIEQEGQKNEDRALVDPVSVLSYKIKSQNNEAIYPYADTIAKSLLDACQDFPDRAEKMKQIQEVIRRTERAYLIIFTNPKERFGLDEFHTMVLPQAISIYADGPEFMEEALRRVLAIGGRKHATEASDFFRKAALSFSTYGYDLHELTREGIDSVDLHEKVKLVLPERTDLDPRTSTEELTKAIKKLEEEIEIKPEDLPPLERYALERELEEERVRLVLYEVFKRKLNAEASPEEAQRIIGLVDQTFDALTKVREIGVSLHSPDVMQWAESSCPASIERQVKDYVLTPSKYYSEIMRGRIDQTLKHVMESCEQRIALFETKNPLEAGKNPLIEGKGLVLSGEIDCRSQDFDYFPELNLLMHFGEPGRYKAEIKGNVMTLKDEKGKILLRRKAISPIGFPVENTALAHGTSVEGVFNVKTNGQGEVVIFAQGYDQHKKATLDLSSVAKLEPNSAYQLYAKGNQVTVYQAGREITQFPVSYLKSEDKIKTEESSIKPEPQDKVQLIYPGCNIYIASNGYNCREISLETQARRVGRALHFIKKIYPETSRIEEVLSEVTVIDLTTPFGTRGMSGGAIGSNKIILDITEKDYKRLAATLVHEEAHLVSGKIIGEQLKNLVAREHRGKDKLLGKKTKEEMVEEAIREIFSRLSALKFASDAIKKGLANYSEFEDDIVDQAEGIRIDIDQMRAQGLLSRRGQRVINGFDRQYKKIMADFEKHKNRTQEIPDWFADLKEIKYRIIPKGGELWSDIWLDDFVTQVVDPILVKYGYLSSPAIKEIGSPIMKALPSPVPPDQKKSKTQKEEISEEDEFEDEGESDEDLLNEFLYKNPDVARNVRDYNEELDDILERAEREAGWYRSHEGYTGMEDFGDEE